MSTDLESQAAYPTYQNGRWTHGLTKRELFAAMAMQGLLARGTSYSIQDAGVAVRYAEALLAALENPRG